MDETTFEKITMRVLSRAKAALRVAPMSGAEIRTLREEAHMSQAVFARCLNLTVGYISRLERGAKRPTGVVLMLLHVVRHKHLLSDAA